MSMKRSANRVDDVYMCGDDCECINCKGDEDAAKTLVKKRRQERFDAMCVDVFKDASEPVIHIAEQLVIVTEGGSYIHGSYILRFSPAVLSRYYSVVYSDLKEGKGVVHGFAKHQTIETRSIMRLLANLRTKYEHKGTGLVGIFGVFHIRVI
jgi:hypothetical protein